MSEMPEVGAKAPLFEGRTQNGDLLRLADYAGRKVAVYFYPKDDTPGCTKQACNLRDNWAALEKAGVAVIGVSGDSAASHAKFAKKYDLPFPLVADPERKILEAYGVWGEKSLYGRLFMGTKRTTFLIDENGVVVHVFKKPRVGNHADEVLKAFEFAS